jgi:hypothetical protein
MQTGSIDVALGLVNSANVICFYTKTQLQMFQLHLFLELSFTQIVFSHYTPSLLHISKMMMNTTTTLQPIAKYSTLLSLFFSTPFILMFFSTILLHPPTFICAHSFVLPFSFTIFYSFSIALFTLICCELQNFEHVHNFQQQTQTTFDNYPILFRP